MYELEQKIRELIDWTKDVYGITEKEAIRSIERKLEDLKL